MTGDAILVLQCLFDTIWRLFTSWHIPGTQTSPAGWAFMSLAFVLAIRFFRRIFVDGGDDK